MKFRKYEELEEDLKEDEGKKAEAVDYATTVFAEEDFDSTKELNGVSFSKSWDNDVEVIYCQFYIDTEAEKYSSYVTSEEDGDKSTTFQQKGSIFDAESAINEFVNFINTI